MQFKAKGRAIRDEADALDCLQKIEASGLSISAWAQAHGILTSSLYRWRHNLAKPVQPRIIEVDLPKKQTPHRYLVQIGDLRLVVADAFDATALKRLIQVLRSC